MTTTRRNPARFDETSADRYEWAHGHRPRGFGSWAFTFATPTNAAELKWFFGTYYSSAKKAAQEYARKVNAHYFSVCS
jgi:hypothetical protein